MKRKANSKKPEEELVNDAVDEIQAEQDELKGYEGDVDPLKVEREAVVIDYDYALSDEELMELAGKIAELDALEDALDMERKMIAAQWASKVKDTATTRKMYSKMFRDKKEVKTAECFPEPDYATGEMVFVDCQTGEEIMRREMLPEERQMNIMDINNEDPGEVVEEDLSELAEPEKDRKNKDGGSKKK